MTFASLFIIIGSLEKMCTFVEKRESKMRTPNTLMRFAALLITATGVLFSAIIYDGKEYTETMMPYSYKGQEETYIVVSGTVTSYSGDRLSIFEINGVNMNSASELPDPLDGKKYFIHFKGQNKNATINISGSNDWTVPEDPEDPGDPEDPEPDPEPEPEPEIPDHISYGGNDYSVEMMPYSYKGNTEYFIVVSGTIASYSGNALNIFEINGVNMNNASVLPDPLDGLKYFIHFKGSRGNSTFNIDGINDWSSDDPPAPVDTVSIDLPYTVSGAGEYYYVTDDALDSVSSSGMDELRINDVNVKNMNTSTIPEAINGQYYIYYKATSSLAAASFYLPEPVDYDTLAVNVPYSYSGSGRYYFSTGEELYSVSSSDMDTLLINEVDYTNVRTTDLPPSINGTYYIYYSASLAVASMILEPEPLDTVNISLPFSRTGVGEVVYATSEEIESVSSSNVEILTINGEDYGNRNSSDMPEKINNIYYIYYKASDPNAVLTIQKASDNPEVINWNGNDYTFIEMPWTYIGSSVTRVYTYGKITSFGTNNFITSLEINGQSYAVNQVHTDSPASIDQKYFITITPKNQKGEFEINGETKKIFYKLNIKVLLEGAL